MEPDLGKLFIGGISWDTDESRLRDYFNTYGEVVEAVIMRDRTTGRARGFGFVVFADPAAAERVVMEKHIIDGRTVEAKRAVPRDDQQIVNRNNIAIQGSPVTGRTKKIFVGGLASTVTENDFKNYFDQFGTITDVVVMYDHQTQRPRGFGFITYDSEEAVDRVLYKTFHELNGKMVEVKRAVPKEMSPGPNRSPLVGTNYSFNRANSLFNNYAQGYNLSSLGSYGVRNDSRFSPVGGGRAGYSPFGSHGYAMGVNLDPGLSQGLGGTSNFGTSVGYGRVLSPYYNGIPNRYSTPIGFGGSNGRNDSVLNSSNRGVWGSSGLTNSQNPTPPATYLGSGSGHFGVFGNSGANWGSSISAQAGTIGYGGGENSFGLGGGGLGRNSSMGLNLSSPFTDSGNGGYEGSHGNLYRGGSMYGDPTWQTASSQLDDSSAFSYALNNPEDGTNRTSEGPMGGYSIANRQPNRGIAT